MSHVATHQKDQPSLIIVFACRLMQIFFRHFPLSYDRWSVTDQLPISWSLRNIEEKHHIYAYRHVGRIYIVQMMSSLHWSHSVSTRRSCFNQWCTPCGAAHIMKKKSCNLPENGSDHDSAHFGCHIRSSFAKFLSICCNCIAPCLK